MSPVHELVSQTVEMISYMLCIIHLKIRYILIKNFKYSKQCTEFYHKQGKKYTFNLFENFVKELKTLLIFKACK